MARASEPTLLSLDRYAHIMQINPAHFNGLVSSTIFPLDNKCSDIWFQYDWQNNDSISLESLAIQIAEAESAIREYLGYPVAPDFIAEEVRPWPSYHRRDAYSFGLDLRNEPVYIGTASDHLISPGRRALSLIDDSVAVVYSDPDGDGFDELATITAATSLTDVKEIKVYFAGKSGARDWEVRPVLTKSISGGNVTITLKSWLLVDPDLKELPPTSAGPEGIALLDTSSYVTTVDLYREYTDTTTTSAEIFWASTCGACNGTGCPACSLTTKTGCARIVSSNPGFMQAQPASYDSDNSQWTIDTWPVDRDPVYVKFWYKAGVIADRYLRGETYDPLDQNLAQSIAYLATARLERPYCNCGTASALARRLMMDMAYSESGTFKNISEEDLDNPFGTMLGEIWAYRKLKKIKGKNLGGYAI